MDVDPPPFFGGVAGLRVDLSVWTGKEAVDGNPIRRHDFFISVSSSLGDCHGR